MTQQQKTLIPKCVQTSATAGTAGTELMKEKVKVFIDFLFLSAVSVAPAVAYSQ